MSKPSKASKICASLADKIKKEFTKIDLILAPAMGGIIVGYEIGRILNIETIFSERVSEKFKLRRDFKIKNNSNVLIVEDVITTGKSSLECSNIVKNAKANIVGYACLINRSNGNSNISDKIVSQVEIVIPTYNKDNLPNHLQSIEPIKPGSRNI
tara:strand:+ start:80 stop:544 length:465 start_codon:yes stop_codon:yes gene_type:complete